MKISPLEVHRLLQSYQGPEIENVRTAISKLAGGDVAKAEHYVQAAIQDYRDVLWWAQLHDEELARHALCGMNVNERICYLGLMVEWDDAVSRGNRDAAVQILRKCEIPRSDIEAILEKRFTNA